MKFVNPCASIKAWIKWMKSYHCVSHLQLVNSREEFSTRATQTRSDSSESERKCRLWVLCCCSARDYRLYLYTLRILKQNKSEKRLKKISLYFSCVRLIFIIWVNHIRFAIKWKSEFLKNLHQNQANDSSRVTGTVTILIYFPQLFGSCIPNFVMPRQITSS